MAINFVPRDYVISPYLESGLFSGLGELGKGVGERFTPGAEKNRRDLRTSRIEAVLAGDPEFRDWVDMNYDLFYNPMLAEGQTTPEFVAVPKGITSLQQIQGIPGLKGAATDWQQFNKQSYNPSTAFSGRLAPPAQDQGSLYSLMLAGVNPQNQFDPRFYMRPQLGGGMQAFKEGGKVRADESKAVPIIAHEGERVIQANANQVPGLGPLLDQLIGKLRELPQFEDGGKVQSQEDELINQLYQQFLSSKSQPKGPAVPGGPQSSGDPFVDYLYAIGRADIVQRMQQTPQQVPQQEQVKLPTVAKQQPSGGQMEQYMQSQGQGIAQGPSGLTQNPTSGRRPQFSGNIRSLEDYMGEQQTQPNTSKPSGLTGNPTNRGVASQQTIPTKETTKPTTTKQTEGTPVSYIQEQQKQQKGKAFRYVSPLAGGAMLDPTTNDLGTLINHELSRGIPVTEVGGKTSTQQQQDKIASVIALKTAPLKEALLKAQVELTKMQASGSIKTDPLAQLKAQLIVSQIGQIQDKSDQELLGLMKDAVKNASVKPIQYTKALLPILLRKNPMLLQLDIPTLRKTLGESRGWWTDESALKGLSEIKDDELKGIMAVAYDNYIQQQQLMQQAGNTSGVTGASFDIEGYQNEIAGE